LDPDPGSASASYGYRSNPLGTKANLKIGGRYACLKFTGAL